MSKTLVTGATGFLGSHLIARLDASTTRLLVRDPTDVDAAWRDFDLVEGSILDDEAIARALDGASHVFHLAGRVSRDSDVTRELYQVHVDGTIKLCRAAKQAGVKRIVLASTSGTVAVTEKGDEIPDETYPPPLALIGGWPYYTSKLYQEQAAVRECAGAEAPELVIMNPSLLLGPGDRRLSSTEDVLKFLSEDIPVVPPGGINFVDVRDVADAFQAAMERGRSGERYLLGGPNWTFQMFFERLARISKVSAPKIKLPGKLYDFAGKAVDALYRHWEKAPPVERISAEMGARYWYVDSSKAKRELGFDPRDPYETLNDTVTYVNKEFLGDGVVG